MKKTKYSAWTYASFLLVATLILVGAGCSGRSPSEDVSFTIVR
jgi:hypothetical protein